MVEITINTADEQQNGFIPDFFASGTGSIQQFFSGDKSISVFVQPVAPSTSGAFPWQSDYASTDEIYFQIGEENAKATGGTFDLTYGASTATELAYNITAAALETAIEGLGAAVSVTSLSEGVYQVQWDDVGVVATSFSSDADLLQPACEIIVTVTNVGSATEKEQRVIEIRQAPVVSATIDTVYTPTGAAVAQKSANSATQNAIYEINLGDAYAGEYTVSIVADGVTTIVVLDASMESDAIGLALAAHPSIYYQDVAEPDNIAVSKSGALITITFIGTLGGTSSVRTITANTIANPTVITSAGHKLKNGDTVVISGSDSTAINGTHTVTVITTDTFSVPVNATVAGTAGSFYSISQPVILYGSNLSLLQPKGFTGTINLNTVALAKAFWATEADELTYPAQFKRVRASGEERTIYGADVTLKRSLVNTTQLFPVPALPFVGSGVQIFADAAERAAAAPLAMGQIGFQVDDLSLWNGTDTTAGSWASSFSIQTPYVGIPNAEQGWLAILGPSGTYSAFFDSTSIVGSNKTYTLPNASGTLVLDTATQTLTNKTLTAPKFADLGFIADANGNELLIFDTVASAVNEITFANAATGASPTFTASGSDTNINIALTPKGSGNITSTSGGFVTSSGVFQTTTGKASIGIASPSRTTRLYVKDNGLTSNYLAEFHQDDGNPWGSAYYNDTFSSSVAGLLFYVNNSGVGYFGSESGTSVGFFTNSAASPTTAHIYLNHGGGVSVNKGLILTPQALSGAGAVDLTTSATDYTSTGVAQALTLANGTVGQIKTITHVVDGGSGILTPTTKTGYTTITFNLAGDSVTLRYCATAGWCVIGSFGVVIA